MVFLGQARKWRVERKVSRTSRRIAQLRLMLGSNDATQHPSA